MSQPGGTNRRSPLGPSGKVKLAPKAKSDAAKEVRPARHPLVLLLTAVLSSEHEARRQEGRHWESTSGQG